MNSFLILLAALGVAAIVSVVWNLRVDGYRAHPVDPRLRGRLLDREEARRGAEDARAALEALHRAEVPPELVAWRSASTGAAHERVLRVHRSAS